MDSGIDNNIVVTDTPSLTPVSDIDLPETDSSTTGINWYSIFKYSLILLILALLGFNLFNYLGKGFDIIKDIFSPILGWFGYGVGETSKSVITTTASGTKSAIDVGTNTLTSGINVLENELTDKALRQKSNYNIPEPDDASSTTQLSKPKNKAGYCYIGEDRGFRSCIQVGEGDKCMSGDIFPSMEICVNPNLRS
jgi:hypothetical protein